MKKGSKKTKKIFVIAVILLMLVLAIILLNKSNNRNITEMNKVQVQNLDETGTNNIYDIKNQITDNPNVPVVGAGMIPIKWDGSYWVITTKDDPDWYNYSNGQMANMMLNNGVYQSEVIANMGSKKLASDNIGIHISPEELRNNICMDTKICI